MRRESNWKSVLYFAGELMIFITVVALVLCMFMGEELKKTVMDAIPITKIFGKRDQAEAALQNYHSLQQEVKQQKQQLQSLQESLNEKQQELDRIYDETAHENERQNTNSSDSFYKKMAKVYSAMPPSNAAQIMGNLSVQECSLILKFMNLSQQADILAQMDAKKAADISVSLKELIKDEQ
jgi:flagellar motility protein MotE (MotC chaperone)